MKDNELRKHLRFYPDPMEIALIDTSPGNFSNFNKSDPEMTTSHIALIENESHTGASLVLVIKDENQNYIKTGTKWITKIGNLSPMRSEVKWNRKIDDLIYKVGIEYLD